MKLKIYPEESGTYLCSNGEIVCVVKFVGWYPNIQPMEVIIINKCIIGAPPVNIDSKTLLQSIEYDRGVWTYKPIYTESSNMFIHKAVPDVTIEELYQTYNELLNNGIRWTNMIGIIKSRLHCDSETAIAYINDFDKRRTKPTYY